MLFSTSLVTAVAAFLPALVSAHVAMIEPATRFKQVSTDLSPLDANGDNYPCFVVTGSEGDLPVYAPGSQQQIGLQGSAVHGGGSCQISITYDNPPNKNSVFKVIKSFEGGCPGSQDTSSNLPANPQNILPPLPYTIPTDIPSGTAVVAWSWFNKIGNREMANIGNGCSTTEGTNVVFPNPGSDLTGKGTGPPSGNCGSSVSPPPAQSSQPPILVVVPTTTPVATPTPTPVQTQPDYQNSPKATPTPAPVPTPKQPTSDSCVDGAIICTGLNTWSMCDHGKPTPMGSVAPGTNCRDGKMVMARSVRFSHDHVRRRHGSTF
ncbi:hypothetical protein L211DRAFT_603204 [Terfezia boudieri ATCC MYA-4762]|uniref:Chitin-binding type-4 domain-containing protein n=1 Tax=Terfezia boudieri ATCC MYA-4762 TaxID=1051890 RepID=A0A3N4LW53_9PEZI|nr:hypothetical protein L211DRAFT_603204 [Terfezia boudieri ATCC MYA-4762]